MTDGQKRFAMYALLLLVGYSFGRYSQPAKVKNETQVVKQDEKTKDSDKTVNTDQDKKKTIITVEITKPDGTKEIKTKTVEDTSIKRNTETQVKENDKSTTQVTKTSETDYRKPATNLNVLVGANARDIFHGNVSQSNACYGGLIDRQILGPVSVGVWGMSCGQGGVSLGLSF